MNIQWALSGAPRPCSRRVLAYLLEGTALPAHPAFTLVDCQQVPPVGVVGLLDGYAHTRVKGKGQRLTLGQRAIAGLLVKAVSGFIRHRGEHEDVEVALVRDPRLDGLQQAGRGAAAAVLGVDVEGVHDAEPLTEDVCRFRVARSGSTRGVLGRCVGDRDTYELELTSGSNAQPQLVVRVGQDVLDRVPLQGLEALEGQLLRVSVKPGRYRPNRDDLAALMRTAPCPHASSSPAISRSKDVLG